MKNHTVSAPVQERIDALRDTIDSAHERLADIYNSARDRTVAGARATDKVVRANPYQTAAIAFGLGIALGVFVGRRR